MISVIDQLNQSSKWMSLIVFLITCAAYIPSLSNDFVWDDDDYVYENPTLTTDEGFSRLEALKVIWFPSTYEGPPIHPVTVQYYPLTYTSFWIETFFWSRDSAMGFHVVNIILHAITAILLALVLKKMDLSAAWLVALIFALHPVNVESVTWVTERKNVLSSVFYLLSAWMFLKYLPFDSTSSEKPASMKMYVLSAVFFVMAVLSKSVTVTLPAVLLVVYWWKWGTLKDKRLLKVIPLFVLGIYFGLSTVATERDVAGAFGASYDHTLVDRFLIAGRSLCFYAGKIVFPKDLIFIYPRWVIDASDLTQFVFPTFFVAVLVYLCMVQKQLGRGPLAAMLCFAGTLFPALGFFNVFPHQFSFVADHFQYLASAMFITLVVMALLKLLKRLAKDAALAKKISAGVMSVIVLVLFVLTWQNQAKYKDLKTIWLDTLTRNEGAWLAHNNYGNILKKEGKYQEAFKHFKKCIELNPNHILGHQNLAELYLLTAQLYGQASNFVLAEKLIDRAMFLSNKVNVEGKQRMGDKVTKEHIGVLTVNAKIAVSMKRYQKAEKIYRELIQYYPNEPKYVSELGMVYYHMKQYDKALSALSHAERLSKGRVDIVVNMAIVFNAKGDWKRSVAYYQRALKANPQYYVGHFNLASVYKNQGMKKEAKKHYQLVLSGAKDARLKQSAQKKLAEIK